MPTDRRAHILLVEDDPRNRCLFHDLLEMSGHRVTSVPDLRGARSALGRERFDLVLLDIRLPDGNGTDLLAVIRADPALRDLPVVAVTGAAMPTDRERILVAGCDGYIIKPISTAEFPYQVLSWLERGRRVA